MEIPFRGVLANGRAFELRGGEALTPGMAGLLVEAESGMRAKRVLRVIESAELAHSEVAGDEADSRDHSDETGSETGASHLMVSPDDVSADYISGVVAAASSVLGEYEALGRRQRLPASIMDGFGLTYAS